MYSSDSDLTSETDPTIQRDQRLVYGTWLFMTLAAFFYVWYFPHNSPFVDEWEFLPALTGSQSLWSWLWDLHNEHRFPLPRLLYYPLFQLTQDFRAGCYVSVLGISLLCLWLIQQSMQLRGRIHWCDLFFPISLLHWGQDENLYMGYQICFMLIPVFASFLLRVIWQTRPNNLFRQGMLAGILTFLLMLCGAAGLAFAPLMALWLLILLFRLIRQTQWIKAGILLIWLPIFAGYIWLYFQGYTRPSHHPPSAGIWPSFVIALEALSMAFGPGAIGLWPVSGPLLIAIGFLLLYGIWQIGQQLPFRYTAWGFLFFFLSIGGMVFGIGWGRSGFEQNMGFALRYGWICWPFLGGIYFLALLYPKPIIRKWVPISLCLCLLALFPFNMGTGLIHGRTIHRLLGSWEKDIQQGMPPFLLIEKYHGIYAEVFQERVRIGIERLQQKGIGVYKDLQTDPLYESWNLPTPTTNLQAPDVDGWYTADPSTFWLQYDLPKEQNLIGVRLVFESDADSKAEYPVILELARNDRIFQENAHGRQSVRSDRWNHLVYWIDGPIQSFRIHWQVRPGWRFRLHSGTAFVPKMESTLP